jgi:hypothetical protein
MVGGVHVKVGMFCGVQLHKTREKIGSGPAWPAFGKPHLAARGLGRRAQAFDEYTDGAWHGLAVVERQGHSRTLGQTVALALDERAAGPGNVRFNAGTAAPLESDYHWQGYKKCGAHGLSLLRCHSFYNEAEFPNTIF